MVQYIDKDTLTEKLWDRRVKNHDFGGSPYSEYGYEDDEILSLIDTLEVIEIGVDFGDPKGDKSAKYIIDTNTLEVKEVDLMIHTIIAECCDWLAMNTNLSNDEIEGCRNLMLTVKEEQCKAQKGE